MKLILEREEQPTPPDDWGDTSVFMVSRLTRHLHLPMPKAFETWTMKQMEKKFRIFDVDAYIHSGVALALSGEHSFPDQQWDVAFGAVKMFVARSETRVPRKALKMARCLVETWNQYLSGDVWYYTIEDDDGNTLDSGSGLYGEEYARKEAEDMLAYHQKEEDEAKKQEKFDRNQLELEALLTPT
jgi:hypothetical protein